MSSTSNSSSDATLQTLADQGRYVRSFIASNRSDTLLRLFDFLLQRSIEGQPPREMEIAEEIFGHGTADSGSLGSRARVAIYRLRKKLDLYYADKPGARLVIPQGEYGFIIQSPDAPCANEKTLAESPPRAPHFSRAMWAAASALLLANLSLAWSHFGGAIGVSDTAAGSTLWQPFATANEPSVVVAGDYFMFVNARNNNADEEVMQDLSIDSVDAFYEYMTTTPEARGKVRNEDLYAVSSNLLGPISRLWSYLQNSNLVAETSSGLDPDMMESSNIIYVGALDALTPLLSNPLSQASQFRCGATCYELIDKPSGRRFLSDSPYLLGERTIPRRDYGYIASYPGPSGKQILIISGTGDAGVSQMVGVVTDADRLEELRKWIGGDFASFEALYQVRTMFNQSYGSALVMARPINTDRIWDKAQRSK
jgi:hypothetical protein